MNDETQPLEMLSPLTGDGAETLPLQPDGFPDDIASADDDEALPQLKVTKKSVIPNWISSNSKQHVVLVRDRSTSMQGRKLKELNEACQDLLQILADPENKDGFIVSVIDFSDGAEKRIIHESASKMHMPEAVCSGGTNFEAALKVALDVVNDFIQTTARERARRSNLVTTTTSLSRS